MKLELISRLPEGSGQSPPLLFVHGTNSGAWVWDVHFLPFFRERGYAAHAVSLRGHGASEGAGLLPWTGLAEYEEDVLQTVRELPEPPVLIGHSMGGLVVQRCFDRVPLAGAVLMASLPPAGLAPVYWRMLIDDPLFCQRVTIVQSMWNSVASTSATVQEMLFSDPLPPSGTDCYLTRWQPESPRAVAELMCLPWLSFPSGPATTEVPLLVIGGERDRLIATDFIADTGRHFGVEPHILPGMAHAMMLEADWRRAADLILSWLPSARAPGAS